MTSVLTQMGLLILCGIAWRIIRPDGLDADLTRKVLATMVFNLLLPALVLSVLWRSPIGLESLKISLFGMGVVLFGALTAWLASLFLSIERRRLGAVILGVAFPNVTYLGLPVLEQTFGPWVRALVIQIDLFAAMPLVLTLGAALGRRYGEAPGPGGESMARSLLCNPPLWAGVCAVSMNLLGVAIPAWLDPLLDRLSAAVIPLILIALGLGLRWDALNWRSAPLAALVLTLKLGLMPWFGTVLGAKLGFAGDKLTALVMEAGMPSMLLGLVYCDRYRLDTGFYAMIATLSTAAAMFTLPFWRHYAG
jgi:predicted permease